MILRRIIVTLVLLSASSAALAQRIQRLHWEELSIVIGKKVSMVTPAGETITGIAKLIEPDALVLQTGGKPDRMIPRASLHALQLHGKTRRFRVIGTTIGSIVGVFAGAVAGFAIQGGGIFGPSRHQGAATAASFGILTAGVVGGYAIGNAADRNTTTLLIEP